MKRIVPLIFITCLCIIFFYKFFFKGLLPLPSDTIVGLYHPFRDVYAAEYPRGVPFKNFLITDPVRQQYPWRLLAISSLEKGSIPTWNPYSFSGVPLLANIQSAVWYPLNFLLFLFPFQIGWSILIFLEPLLAGVFLYFYLKNLKLSEAASVIATVGYIFSGFSIAWLEWGTIIQVILWLPLLLLCVNHIFDSSKRIWYLIFVLGLCSSFFAGHWQTFFYMLILLIAYGGYQFIQNGKNIKALRNLLFLMFLGLILTAIQWVPSFILILHSARDIDQLNKWREAGWFIPWQHLVQFIAPDFFGNPTTLNYWGVWNYAELVGYVGVIPLFFSVFAMVINRSWQSKFFTASALIGLLFALPTGISALPFILNIPILSSFQPTRLLSIIDFSLVVLTAIGIDTLLQKKRKVEYLIGAFSVIFIILWGVVLFSLKKSADPANWRVSQMNLLLPTVLFIAFGCLLYFITKTKNRRYEAILLLVIVILTTTDMLRFAWKFTPFTPQEFLYPRTKIITYLQQQQKPFRIMTDDDRILPPNFSSIYKIENVSGYDPLYLTHYAEFIATLERNKPNVSAPWGFNRIVTPKNSNSDFLGLLNVKYLLSFNQIKNPQLQKIMQEGQTILYENKRVLPRAFFVKSVIPAVSDADAIHALFANSQNIASVAIVQATQYAKRINFAQGKAEIISYNEKSRTFKTENSGDGFLVITDIYYPSWKVSVDGKTQQLVRTDYTFLGVQIAEGVHTVKLSI